MKLGLITLILCFGLTPLARAHDDGHGPKLSDTGQFGGLVSGIVKKSDAGLGAEAPLVYKAELVRSMKGVARLYVYDSSMKPLEIGKFGKTASASLSYKVKGQWKSVAFELQSKEGSFQGAMPKALSQPYNIDVILQEGGQEFLTAFDNLD